MTDLQSRPARPPVPTPRPQGEHPGSPVGLAVLVGLVLLAAVAGGWPLLVVIAAIVVMIFLHELGHYLTAKWAGMKVTEFFIGFGPRIWSFRRGETEYGIKAIPAGAYVKIIGMHNLDEFDPADADRTYMSKPYWRRLSVAVAGSTMHFLLALVGLFALFALVGLPGGRLVTSDSEEDALLETAAWSVSRVSDDSAAEQVGIEPGDVILTVDGEQLDGFPDLTRAVAARPGEDVELTVLRDGQQLTFHARLGDRNPSTGEDVGFLGVGPRYSIPDETLGVGESVRETFAGFGKGVRETFAGLGRILSPSGLFDLGERVVSGDEEAGPTVSGTPNTTERSSDDHGSDRAVSIIGVGQIGSALVEDEGFGGLLALFVTLNIFIGVFNLVPLLPLDGGHVAIATYEKIRSMLQGGRAYHVDVAKLLPLTYAVVLVLVFLGISTVYLDITDPITGG